MRLFNRLSDDSRSSDVNQENKVFRGRKNAEGKRRGDVADSLLSPRKLGMENLEERQLLSVNPIGTSEYQEIRDAYADLELPRSLAEINVIEVTDLSGAALQAAVDQAAQTPQSDLVLLRTTADDYVVDLDATAIKINIDSEKYGDLTILGRGENALVVETTDSNAFTVLNGNVAFDSAVLYNYSSIQYAGDLIVSTSDANVTLGSALVMANQIETTDSETGEKALTYSFDAAMTAEKAEQYGVARSTRVSEYRVRQTVEGDFNVVRREIDATLREKDHYFGYNPSVRYAPGVNANTIYDAESVGYAGWVGAISNMLAYTGWAQQAGFSTEMTRPDGTTVSYDSVEDAVADYLKQGYMNANEGTASPQNWNLTAAQMLDYFFSGNDKDVLGDNLSTLTNAIEGGGFFMDVDFSKVGGYVASSDSMIDDALAALRAGKAVTMEVVVTNTYTGAQTREYVSVWGYYYQPGTEEKAAHSNTTNNAANYLGLICTNPKFGTELEQVVDGSYAWPGVTDPITHEMTNAVDVPSQRGEENYDTYHTYLLERDGSSWRFATAPYTYLNDQGAVQGAREFPEGFQYYGGDSYAGFYAGGAARTYTAEIVGFSWIQQYTDAIPEVATTQDEILSLESMPGNTDAVIYLHFGGADGTGWDGLAHPALNLDGSAGYGVEELQLIEEVWRRVAEDYAPFNVNVTTDANVWANAKGGIRVVIGGESPDAGGLSYVGVFGAQKQDNYVYPWSLGLSAKNIAEAATHEVGHTFGLGHDGYEHNEYYGGNATWGPIMGVGYNSEITQWSKGDYVNATNRQDDLAIIAGVVGYRADDFGDTVDYAEALDKHYVAIDINNYDANESQYMGTYRVEGIIETNTDYDIFSFVSNGGSYVVDVSGDGADYRFVDGDFGWTTRYHDEDENALFGGLYYAKTLNYTNLNLKVELLDENGDVVLIGMDGEIMKLGYGEYYKAEDNYHFVVYDQFGKPVYDEFGNLKEGYLAVDDSVFTTFSHFVTPKLEAGKKYYISVTGVGQGNDATNGYSDYGSIGQYELSMHESYENFRVDAEKMDVQDLSYANAVDNVLTWQEAFVYAGRRLEDGSSYLGNTLQFNASLSGQTLDLRETLTFDFSRTVPGQPLTAKRFVLDATDAWDVENDRPGITIDANEKFRTIYVDNTTVELYGFTITGGVAETTNVIYLYFGGIDGPGWSGEAHPAFDLDGDASTFSAEELAAINEIYLRVVEDYSPYNVTVTTDQAVFDAATNAIRVVVGGTGNGRGGVAYMNSFGTQKQDCYVFPNSLGLDAKNIAEAISHEVGHTLGLDHDGQNSAEYYGGANGWAPIMGTGYGPMLSQWSKGEYAGATNTQDDLATIAGYLGYKDDDGGDEQDDARALRESYLHAGNLVADGILESTGDVDWFSFLATKETFVVDVVGVGADFANANAEGYAANMNYYTNLNLVVELYDEAGNLLYKCNPDSSLFAHFEANNLTVGERYFVRVSAEGQGDANGANGGYSNYGCVGQYYVTVAAGTLAEFVGETRYQTNASRLAVENGAINATKDKDSGYGVNGQTNNGGGVYNNYGWLTIGDSIIAGNRAYKAGGGVYNSGGEYEDNNQHDGWLYLVNTSIVGNIVTDENSIGGGFYNESGAVATLVDVTIAGNTADYSGGGVQNAGYIELYNSIVAKNEAAYGADVYNQSGKAGTVAYDSLIGDESRNTNYAAYKNGANTQNGGGSLIGTSVSSKIDSTIVVYDPKFVAYREYAVEDWSSVLWRSWNLRLQGDSPAVDLGTTDNLNAENDYDNPYVTAFVYDSLGLDRYYVSFDADLAGQDRVSGDGVDAGAYEVLAKPDLTGFTPTAAGSDVVNDWENSIVISRAEDDQTGSIAPFLVDEDLFLNLSFVNQGVQIGTNFETTVYLWRYEPGASKDEMFAASKLDGSQVALMNVKIEFEANRAMPDGQGGVAAKIVVENLATGETQTFEYDGSTSSLALDNVKIGSIEEVVSALVEKGQMNVENEEGYYVFGYQLDSTNALDEHREDNNVALTTSYFNVVESPVSVNNSIVVTTTEDVVDAYDGEISLREAVEVYAGSFYYKEVALPEGAVFESNGVTYAVKNGKFYVDSSTEYNVYPGEVFTFVETVETPLTWDAEAAAHKDADGETVLLGNGASATIVIAGETFDAIWDETNGVWAYVDATETAATAQPGDVDSATLIETPIVSVKYQENVYFDADDKETPIAEGTKATFNGVEVEMIGGVWSRVEESVYTLDDVQEMGNFILEDGTEVAVVNGVFRRLGTNDVAVVLDGAEVRLANGETAVYDAAQSRFVATKTTEYAVNNGDKVQIGDVELTFSTKAYVDDGGYRYFLVDGVRVTLANGYEVVYDAARDAFLFESAELAGKIDSGATIVWNGKEYAYKAGVAIVEKASRETNAVVFDANLDGQTFELTRELTLGTKFTLDCVDADGNQLDLTIQSATSRLFNVTATGDVTIRNFALSSSGSSALDKGGVVYNEGALTVENVSFAENQAMLGGAIYNAGSLTVVDSTFDANDAENGGSIYNDATGTLTINGATFGDDVAISGGSIYNLGTAFVEKAIFNGGVGMIREGGAIYAGAGETTVLNSTFNGSSAIWGGAIYNAVDSTLFVDASTFDGTNAGMGGAIYNLGDATVEESDFVGTFASDALATPNLLTAAGGAIFNAGTSKIADSNFGGAKADGLGGAVYSAADDAELKIIGAAFVGNSATLGGAIYAENVSLNNVLLAQNVATDKGGAIYANTIALVGSTVANNSALDAGGVYVGKTATIDNSILAGNVATGTDALGADLYTATDATTTLRSSLLLDFLRVGETTYQLDAAYRSLIGVDPKFVDAENGDYRLTATSPAVNAGSNDWIGDRATDLDGGARVVGLTVDGVVCSVDVGAYEYQTVVAPDLAIDAGSVDYWFAGKQNDGETKVVQQDYFIAGQDVCLDFTVENIGDGTVLDNFAYAVTLVGKNAAGQEVYNQTQAAVYYKGAFERFDWLNAADWLAPGATVDMLANFGALPAGSYEMILTLDVQGLGAVYERGEEDGFEGENNNVFLGSFNVYEAPSVVVATENDVVDRTDCVVSLREAIEYAGNYSNVVTTTVADGAQYVLESGEILTVRGGMLTRKVDVVVKNGETVDLQDGDRFYLSGKPVFYRAQINGGYFVDADGNQVDLSTGTLTYPDGTVAEVKLNADQYVSFVGEGSSDLNPDEGDRYAYRTFQAPGQDPVKLVDGETYDYANVKFTYHEYYEKDGVAYSDGAFVFEDGSVVAYADGGTLEIANLTLGTLETRDEIVLGALTLEDGSTLEVQNGVATLKIYVGSTVTFAESTQGKTIALDPTLGALDVDKSVRVDGADRAITVDGGGATGIFRTSGRNVEIANLTLANGSASRGAAIDNVGWLTVENVAFVGNRVEFNGVPSEGVLTDGLGGAIYSDYFLTVKGGSFTDNFASEFGGAIFSLNKATIDGAIFTGNSAFAGGAIASQDGTMDVVSATFEGNKADRGGAVYVTNVVGNFDSVVFKNNEATEGFGEKDPAKRVGGAVYATESAALNFKVSATFEGNKATGFGGAIYADKEARVGVNGDLIANGNVAGEGGGAIWTNGRLGVSGNLTANDNQATNGAYGAIYVGDALIVGGDATFERNQAAGDGGAVYAEGANGTVGAIVVEGSLIANDNQAGGSGGALYAATRVDVGGSATLKNNAAGGSGGAIYAGTNVNVNGTAIAENNVANGDGGSIYAGAIVSVNDAASFVGGSAANGGAIYAEGSVRFGADLTATGLSATQNGGALYVGGSLTVSGNATFENNAATGDFGALVALEGATFNGDLTAKGNSATNGAAIAVAEKLLVKGGATFENNAATDDFGALIVVDGAATFEGDLLAKGNSATNGAAITVEGALTVKGGATFENNTATEDGAALVVLESATIGGDLTAKGNVAGDGGALGVAENLTVGGSATLENNVATENGPLYVVGAASIGGALTATGNSGANGGAINAGSLTVSGFATLTGNAATADGGAIYAGSVSLNQALVAKNVASGFGGAIYADSIKLVNATVAGNSALYAGGLYVGASATVDNSIIAGNAATFVPAEPAEGEEPAAPVALGVDVYVAENAVFSPRNSLVQNVEQTGAVAVGAWNLQNDYRCVFGVDPQFVDAANGDYSLQGTSTAINAGSNALIDAAWTTDLAGNARLVGLTVDGVVYSVDMGAYEYQTVVAPDLAFGDNPVSFWFASLATGENPTDFVQQNYFVEGTDAVLEFNFANIGDGKVIDKFNVTLTVRGTADDGTTIEKTYRYAEGADYCDWLAVGDWLDPNETIGYEPFNLGSLAAGKYELTLTLDGEGVVAERGEEDGFEGANNNVYTTEFEVRERPSLVVTTTADVVDPLDGEISLREAVEVYAGPSWISSKTLIQDGETFRLADLTQVVVRDGAATFESKFASVDGAEAAKLADGAEFAFGYEYVQCAKTGERVYSFVYPNGDVATFTSAPGAELTLTLADGKTATVKTMSAYDYLLATGVQVDPSVYVDVVVVDGAVTKLDAIQGGIVYDETQVVFRENAFVGADGKAFAPALGAQVDVDGFVGTFGKGGVVGADGTVLALQTGKTYVVDGVSGTFAGAGFVLPNGSFEAFADGGAFLCENGKTIATSVVVETISGEFETVDGVRLNVAGGVATIASFVDSTITFADSLEGETIVLDSAITFAKSATVDANDRRLTVSGGEKTNVFVVDAAATVKIVGLTIADAVGAVGSALNNAGTTTLTGVDFVDNKAVGAVDELEENGVLTEGVGGAIYNAGTLTVEGAFFRGNEAAYYGGAICSVGTLDVVDAIFANNVAGYYGGAIYLQNGTATIDDSNLSLNQATYGGAIAVAANAANASLKIANSIVANNTANAENANVVALRGRSVSGGAIFAEGTGASVVLTNVTVADNKAIGTAVGGETFAAFGGAIALDGASIEIVNSIVAQNAADFGVDLNLANGATATVKASLIGVGDDCGTALTVDENAKSFVGTAEAPIDPKFGESGYALDPSSPAVNAGKNDWAVATDGTALTEDYFGNNRVVGVVLADGTIYAVDMGAIETQSVDVAAPDLTFGENPLTAWCSTSGDFVAGWDVRFSYEFGNFGTSTIVDSFGYTLTVAKLDANGEVVAGSEQTFRRDYVDAASSVLGQRDWLVPNETVAGTWNLGALAVGNYRLTLALDVDGKVVELDEANNVFETTFGVSERPSLVVTTEADVVDAYDGLVSLREALDAVGKDGSTTTAQAIELADGQTFALTDGGTLAYVGGKLVVRREVETTNEAGETVVSTVEEDALQGVAYDLANGTQIAWNGDDTAVLSETIAQTITFAEAVYGKTIVVGSELTLDRSATIEGTGANVVLSGADASRILRISGGADVQVSIFGLTFQNGSAAIGGAIYNDATLTLTDVAFNDNVATVSGGAIYNDADGTLTATNATFAKNSATVSGGAIFNAGTALVERGADAALAEGSFDFAENAAENGAAIYNRDGALTISNVAFSKNVATVSGGAVYNENGLVEIVAGASFVENTATYGGALVNYRGGALVENATFVGNVALKSAGAIDNYGALELTAVKFDANRATVGGGAIYNAASVGDEDSYYVALFDVEFANNEGGKFGGAIYNAENSAVFAEGSATFDGNRAETAGAVYNLGYLTAENGSTFANNAATNGAAGAIYNAGIATFVGATFDANSATTDGGAVFNAAGAEFYATSSDVSANVAERDGGAFFNEGTLSVSNSVLWKNVAGVAGGAIASVQNGQVVLRSSTVAANSASNAGGVANNVSGKGRGRFEAYDSIVASNFATTSVDFDSTGSAKFVYSLLGSADGASVVPTRENSLSGDAGFAVAPIFDANGALTNGADVDLRLVSTSRAVNVGNAAFALDATGANVLANDLDGAIRVCSAFDAIDMGAYEFQFETPSTTVSTEFDVVDPTDGLISLREAIGYARQYGELSGSSITFGENVAKIMLNSTLVLDADVTIEALESGVVLDASNVERPSRVVEIVEGANVELINLTLTGGRMIDGNDDMPEYCGGGLYNAGELTLTNVAIVGNEAVYGGGLYNVGSLTAIGLLLEGNSANSYGGGYSRGDLYVENSTIRGNAATYQGGGFGVYTSNAEFVGVAIYGNRADKGAGVFADVNASSQDAATSATTLTNCTVVGNVADEVGGGVWAKRGLTVVNSIVFGNVAPNSADLYSSDAANVSYSAIDVDPNFVEFATPTAADLANGAWKNWDLTLQVGSSAINAGLNAALPNGFATDLAGADRVVGGTVDLGAFEEQGNVAPSGVAFEFVAETIDSTTAVGTEIATVAAVDDNLDDSFRYEIVADSADARYFAIGGENGDRIVLTQAIPVGVYEIVVRATDSGEASVVGVATLLVVDPANPNYATPTITTVVGDANELTVFWNVDGEAAKDYVVQYRVDGGDWKTTNALTGDRALIQDEDVQIDSVVDVRVKALASVDRNESAWSAETSFVVEATPEAFNVKAVSINDGRAYLATIDSIANVHSSWRVVWGDGSEDFVSNELSSRLIASHVYAQAGTFAPTLYVDGSDVGYVLGEHVVSIEPAAALALGETTTAEAANVFSAVEAVAVKAVSGAAANDFAVECDDEIFDLVWEDDDETVVEVAAATTVDPVVLVAKPTTRAERATVVAEARRDAFADFVASTDSDVDADFETDFFDLESAFDEAFLNDLFEN